ncbi:unnamed protein product [Calypogeia fissa]
MSAADESGGGGANGIDGARDTTMLVAGDDPIVPILDIPPNEDLGLSTATMEAVEAAAMEEHQEALDQMGATAATASAEEISSSIDVKAPEVMETTTEVSTTTITTTTTTEMLVSETESSSLPVTEVPMEETITLGKREKPEEEGLGFSEQGAAAGDGESGPPAKKVKESTDVAPEAEVAAGASAAPATEKEKGEKNGVGKEVIEPVKLGPKTFYSGVEMFTYFYELLHAWVSNVDVNKYEFLVLSDLIKKGHRDAEAKIGPGIQSFQIRFHPGWHSRCYYLIRTDGSVDDFSYRKCVDKIMPLPENMFSPSGDLLVDQLLGPGEDASKWQKKNKGKDNFGDGWRPNHGGQSNKGGGGRGGRGGRRGGGRGGGWSR